METQTKQEKAGWKIPYYKELRGSVFPVKPTDTRSARLLKESGFYLFLVMLGLITISVGGAIMFVL